MRKHNLQPTNRESSRTEATMKTLILAIVAVGLSCQVGLAEPPYPTFKKLQLTDKFYCEGAYYADFNKDGHLDVVSGPYWYEGPDFQKKHEIYPPKAFDPKAYSDVFITFTGDFNGDGWPDVLYLPFPGAEAYWYENPAGKDQAVEETPGTEGRGQRVADVGRHQRRRPAGVDLQRNGPLGLRHLRPGQARSALGVSSRHAPSRLLSAFHARHRLWRHQRRRPDRSGREPRLVGAAGPGPSRASLGRGIPSTSRMRLPRCSSTTWTATG